MSKRKASYDLTFKLKAVKCAEEKIKEAAAREFNVDPRRNSETVMEIASTESCSPIPGVHMCLYTWWPLTTLRSLACHRQNSNNSPA